MQLVIDAQLTLVAIVLPNLKLVAEAPGAKPEPTIVTLVPPAVGPLVGVSWVTVGGPYLKPSATDVGLVPPGLVTVTSTVPLVPGGDTAVIDLAEFTVKPAAGTEPNITPVAVVKPLPVIVTVVPPAGGPAFGATFVTAGTGSFPTSIVCAVPMLVPSPAKTVSATV